MCVSLGCEELLKLLLPWFDINPELKTGAACPWFAEIRALDVSLDLLGENGTWNNTQYILELPGKKIICLSININFSTSLSKFYSSYIIKNVAKSSCFKSKIFKFSILIRNYFIFRNVLISFIHMRVNYWCKTQYYDLLNP